MICGTEANMANMVYVGKKSSFWRAVKFLIAAAVVCFVVTKIYQKVVAKKKAAQAEAEDLDLDLDEVFGEDDVVVTLDGEA